MNVVFDLGGVVVTWQPGVLIARLFIDPVIRATVRREIVDHEDWLALDRGDLTQKDALLRAAARTGLPAAEVTRFFDAVPASLVAIPETVDLMYRVKHAGHRLYCLSNMPAASIAHLERAYDFWEVFEGTVISSRIGLIKPEPAIYAYLLERYRLVATDTIFIDDIDINLAAAAACGIQPMKFEHPAQCGAALARLGLI